MKINIQGKKYNFEILAEDNCFYAKAKHKFTKRVSCINNLNLILSEFGISEDYSSNSEYYDSFWIIPKKEVRKFGKIARELLSDKTFRDYLEKKLDEDRKNGEWENIEK